MRIVFLVRSLNYGGAERQLVVLANGLRARGHAVSVVVFYAAGPLQADLERAGVCVRTVDKRARWDVVTFLVRLCRTLREERPAVLHGYLAVPNILATALRSAVGRPKVVWGLRASDMDLSHYDWLTGVVSRLARGLSSTADLLIVNSRAGYDHAARDGYPARRMVVIPNGIDTERFAPDPVARARVRAEWDVPPGQWVIGVVGRLDPMKGHATFLEAAAHLAAHRTDVRFVCVGSGDSQYHEHLRGLAHAFGIDDRIRWVAARPDMTAVYNALDIVCSSSSFGEGFSNAVGEAMACGRPCVVTDVGDSAWLVADSTLVVPPRDPCSLADRLSRLLDSGERTLTRLGDAARRRIIDEFSIERLVDTTEAAIAELAGETHR